jgi:hypothetical protein
VQPVPGFFSHGRDAISLLLEMGALISGAWKAGLYIHAVLHNVLYSEMHVEGRYKKRNCVGKA